MRRLSLVEELWSVVRKDLVIEFQGRVRTNATLFFAVLVILLFSFAMGPQSKLLAQAAGGFLWLTILMSSTLGLGESFRIEREDRALDGLRMMGVRPASIFLGKALVNALHLTLLGVVLVPLMIAVYDVELRLGAERLVVILALGSFAISAPGTLYATMAVLSRARDVLLPLLLFPIVIPVLLAAVKATTLVVEGDPMEQLEGWSSLLIVFSGAYWTLCTLLYGKVIEDA